MAVASHRTVSPKTLLRLGRVSNLPTVWTNVPAGNRRAFSGQGQNSSLKT
jgi:hypothetical protein